MIYVTSDLHGFPLAEFERLLQRAGFGKEDFLFVLGDVIDRGEAGVELLRWLTEQSNVQLILGNHEAMLLSCQFLFQEVSEESLSDLDGEKLNLLNLWMRNGAAPTLAGLRKLLKKQPDVLEGILDYLHDAPLYDVVEAGGRRFVLVHAGLGNFEEDKPLWAYAPEELLWERPNLQTRYFDDTTVIFGHTPTLFYAEDFRGRAVRTNSWICIDTGAAAGGSPMLLRLDDLTEFY